MPVLGTITYDPREDLAGMTIKVRIVGCRRLRARTWLACRLFLLAGYIAGTKCDVQLLQPGQA